MALSQKALLKAALSGVKTGLLIPFVAPSVSVQNGALVSAAVSLSSQTVADMVKVPAAFRPAVAGGIGYAATMVPQIGLGAQGQDALMFGALVAACDFSSDMVGEMIGLF